MFSGIPDEEARLHRQRQIVSGIRKQGPGDTQQIQGLDLLFSPVDHLHLILLALYKHHHTKGRTSEAPEVAL